MAFVATVFLYLPVSKYFRHNKFSSFRRQLNLYGYRKVIKGPDAGAYMHPSFQRGRPDLLGEVKKGKVTEEMKYNTVCFSSIDDA